MSDHFCQMIQISLNNPFASHLQRSMSNKIQILPVQDRLQRGESCPVRILVQFDKPTKVRGIRARFRGAEKTEATYVTTTTDSNGQARTETKTATQYVDIVKNEFLLFGDERKGFFSRLGDSMATWVGGGSAQVIDGEHEFTVNLPVPQVAPASFKGKKCEVFYQLMVSVDLPIKIDWSQTRNFEVVPEPVEFSDTSPVHVVFPDASGRSLWDKAFGKNVKLNLALDRDTLAVGEKAMAMLTVESPEPLKVNKIDATLVGREQARAHGHSDSHSHKYPLGQIESPNVISSDSVHEFEIAIPVIEAPYTQVGSNFEVDWSVEVRLSVPWAKDPVIQVPIKIMPRPIDSN